MLFVDLCGLLLLLLLDDLRRLQLHDRLALFDLDWRGLDICKEQFEEMERVDPVQWRKEVIQHEELFIDLHDHLPSEMVYERELLICRL